MAPPLENTPSEIPPAEQELLAGADRRIYRAMLGLGLGGVALFWLWMDWRWAAGFAVGAALSALNFHWMKRAVGALAQLAAPSETPAAPQTSGSISRFVLRYALMGGAGYAIFKSSFVSLTAFFFGLFLFVAAILAEVAYQIYLGFRKI